MTSSYPSSCNAPAPLYGEGDPEAAGRAVRVRRERLGLTQRQIALRARCGLNAVSNLEAGFWPVTNRSKAVPAILAVLDQAEEDLADAPAPAPGEQAG